MLFDPLADNLIELDQLEAQIAVREIIEKTRHCQLTWSRLSPTLHKSNFEDYELFLSFVNESGVTVLDVIQHGQSVFSLKSTDESRVGDLYNIVQEILTDRCEITNELIENSFLQAERCPFTYWLKGKGGVVVGGGTGIRNYSCECENSEICLVCDTTGSMGGVIGQIRNVFSELNEMFTSDTCKWAVVDYKDFEDGGVYADGWKIVQTFTNDFDAVQTAINLLQAGGGGDTPEQAFSALKNSADGWVTDLLGSTDPDTKKIIIWAGDVPSWNSGAKGFPYPSRQEVKDALLTQGIQVLALNTVGAGSGLDGGAGTDNIPNQASDIVNAVGGQVISNITTYDLEALREIVCTFVTDIGSQIGLLAFRETAWPFIIGEFAGFNVLEQIDYSESDNGSNLDTYRLYFGGFYVDASGNHQGSLTPPFDEDEWDSIKNWIIGGGRLYVAGEASEDAQATAVNDFMDFLGVGLQLEDGNIDNTTCSDGTLGSVEVVEGMDVLKHKGTRTVIIGAGSHTVARTNTDVPYIGITRLGSGYVMLSGDGDITSETCVTDDTQTFFRNYYFMEDPIGDTLIRDTLFPDSTITNEWTATSSHTDIDEGCGLVDFSNYIVHNFALNIEGAIGNNNAIFKCGLTDPSVAGPYIFLTFRAFIKRVADPAMTGSVLVDITLEINGNPIVTVTFTATDSYKMVKHTATVNLSAAADLNTANLIFTTKVSGSWGSTLPSIRVAAADLLVT